jgi:hypothetical protein
MYQEDGFVVLETDLPEQFLTREELLVKLQHILLSSPPENLPREAQKLTTIEEQAKHLTDKYFELELPTGKYLQWYVVRLENR